MMSDVQRKNLAAHQTGSYAGKVAFVTGAGSGIGRATALAFVREGASVVVCDISEQNVRDTARRIEELGGRALAVTCDVTRTEDVKAALDETIESFGRLDVSFNNAGVEQATAAAADITEEEWDRIVTINLRGVFLCMKYEIPLMLEQGGRRDREHLLGRRGQRLPRRRCVRRRQRGTISRWQEKRFNMAQEARQKQP